MSGQGEAADHRGSTILTESEGRNACRYASQDFV